jgi:catechol 2,3-dioxygenase-like lactoylglutathione lyase family enzyme
MQIIDSNLSLMIQNMEQSIAFYLSLGFVLKQRWGNYYAQLSAPGIVIGLHPASIENLHGNSGNASLGFVTNNLEETKNQLEILHIPFQERTEEGGRFLHFYDPDGTALYFIKPKW